MLANTISLPQFPEASRSLTKTPGSETKDVVAHDTAGSLSFMFKEVPFVPKSNTSKDEGPGGCAHMGGP